MANDPAINYLLKRVMGLQAVVAILMQHLIDKGVTNQESLFLALDAVAITADLDADQLEAFESVKNTISGKGVWIPQVIQGGKSTTPGSETDSDSE